MEFDSDEPNIVSYAVVVEFLGRPQRKAVKLGVHEAATADLDRFLKTQTLVVQRKLAGTR